jgi:hypothetical protein
MKPHHRRYPGRLLVATRVPISGRIDDKRLDTLQAILGVLRNAFVKACIPQLKKLKPADEPTTH